MRWVVVSCVTLSLLLSAAAVGEDKPPAPPAQAAEKVLAAIAARDVSTLRWLAGKYDPDPWLVADELLLRGKADEAGAFATAAPRVDVEKLPAFVASRRGRSPDAATRRALAAADAALAARNWPEALAALDAARVADDPIAAIRLEHDRGFALRGSNRLEESDAALLRVADSAQAVGWLARAAIGLAEAARSAEFRGDFRGSLDARSRCLAILERCDQRAAAATALESIGDMHRSLGDYPKALGCFERALRLADELADRDGQVHALWGIASNSRAAGRPRGAVDAARKAVALIGELVCGVGEEQGAIARDRFADLFDIGATESARLGDAASACFFLESGRAGALLESLATKDALGAALLPAELRAAEGLARAHEAAATAALRRAIDGGKLDAIAAARKDVDAARTEVGDVVARIQRDAKAVANVAYPTADSLDAIRGRLADGEALVLYGLTDSGALALVVTLSDARTVALGKTEDVDAACAALRPDANGVEPAPSVEALRKLVVDPLKLDARTTRVLVSPTGALSYVPFALLLPDRDVCCVPSGTTWGLLSKAPPTNGKGVLALGDPDYDVRSAPMDAAVAQRGGMKLVRLPATGVEAKAVGDVVLLGTDASESGLRDALARKSRWRAVHLACHGLVDPERPMFSSLALTPSGDDDGFLTALEVFRMKCPADLVVLSACETGKGRSTRRRGSSD